MGEISPDDLLTLLKFVGETGRVSFLDSVGEFLNDMRASDDTKTAWRELVEDAGAEID